MRELRELELKAEAEKEAAAREHELKMAGLGKHPPSDKATAFDPSRNIRLVPFQEKDVNKYFAHFEKVVCLFPSLLICYTKRTQIILSNALI